MKRKRNHTKEFVLSFVALTIIVSVCTNIYLFKELHFSSLISPIEHSDAPQYTAVKYEIDPLSPKPSINDIPKWPPMKIFIYPEDKFHTEDCLYPPEMPNRYVNESGYWFQRMLEPTIHHQFLNSPMITNNPDEADFFFIPHYSRMCSGLDTGERWLLIPSYLRRSGKYFDRYSSADHFIMHSVPHYGDKPADKAVTSNKAPMIGILDLKLSAIKSNPWILSRTIIVPFITLPTTDSFTNKRPISVFVAMSTSTKGLKASSAILRQKIQEQLLNVSNSEIVLINRKEYSTFKNALDSLPLKMKLSKFCIVPPGDAPSSKRFYDAISHYCVPFLLADYFILPYEDIAVDYNNCILQLPAKNVSFLANVLNKEISKGESDLKKKNLKEVNEKFTWNYRKRPKAGQALWTLSWAIYDKVRMLKPYENNEMTGFDNDPSFVFPS